MGAATAFELGWHHLENGDLIEAAESGGYSVLVTCDKNLRYQQNLAGRRLSIVVLSTNDWPRIQAARDAIMAAIVRASRAQGTFVEVTFV